MDEILEFPGYTHIYSNVGAYQLTPENRKVICLALLHELREGRLAYLSYTGPTLAEPNASIIFRYMDETSDRTLNGGDYLVLLPIERYVSMTEAEFEQSYQPSGEMYPPATDPLVDYAEADVAVLME